ncbi:MAG TPA: Virginiamycin B lyase [Ktedonobacteraceae bacterium]|nr:Virginiamycin B lyase [Ktedonobacteraceae bacterium]
MKCAIRHRRMIFGLLLLAPLVLGLSLSRLVISTQTATALRLSPGISTSKASPLTAGTVTEYAIPTKESQPVGITTGPDGNLWFTEGHGNKIGKVTPGGVFTEYTLPTTMSEPEGITSGPDGNLWFTEFNSIDGNRIGKISTTGQITEYALPHDDSEPESITSGPDSNLWFTEFDGNRIGKITTTGQLTEYMLPNANSEPEGITSGPCGDGMQAQCLWFTEYAIISNNRANIGRITTDGTITEYQLPSDHARANDITLGSGGVLYFTEQINVGGDVPPFSTQAKIGQITTSGQVQLSELASLANGGCLPNSIVNGSDGNLWFTEYYQIGTITPTGTVTEYTIPKSDSLPDHITAGPDGNLWFAEYSGNKIGKITTQ